MAVVELDVVVDRDGFVEERLRAERLRDWLAEPPAEDLQSAIKTLYEVQQLFLEECAQRLEGPINRFLQGKGNPAYTEKIKISRQLGELLSDLRLGFVCPKTGELGLLHGAPDPRDGLGKWRLRVTDDSGNRRSTIAVSELPHLKVAPHGKRADGRRLARRETLDR